MEKNDLPQVKAELDKYLQTIRRHKPTDNLHPTLGLIVEKKKIAANGDYNLSGERHRENGALSSKFPKIRLGDICAVNPQKKQFGDTNKTRVSFVPMVSLNEHQISFRPTEVKQLSEVSSSYTYFENNDVLLAKVTPCFENGKAGIARELVNGIGFGSSEFYVIRAGAQALPEWIYFCVMHPIFRDAAIAQMTGTGGLQRVPRSFVEDFEIPLPPLEMQKEIVAEIQGYQKVIDGARAVLDNYRPHIPIHPDWSNFNLGSIASLRTGTTPDTTRPDYYIGNVNFVKTSEIANNTICSAETHISDQAVRDYNLAEFPVGTVLMAMYGQGKTRGQVAYLNVSACTTQNAAAITPHECLESRFLFYVLLSQYKNLRKHGIDGHISHLNLTYLKEFKIPLPPLSIQQQIVAEIEAEQALVAAN
jgi:type I restriction enzyme M protein